MALWLPRASQALVVQSSRSLLIRNHASLYSIHYRSLRPVIRQTPPAFRFQSSSSKQTPTTTSSSSNATPNADAASASEPKAATPALPQEPLGTRVWKKVKHEAQHYWHGSKLLVSEVRISSRLQWKILQGDTLTRRERRQVAFPSLHEYYHFVNSIPTVETDNARFVAFGSIRGVHHRAIHGTATSRRAQALPQHAPVYV